MSQEPPPPAPVPRSEVEAVPIRSAMLSTRRLSLVCPSPSLDCRGRSSSSRLDRNWARARFLARLWSIRLSFRFRGLAELPSRVVALRMSLRLAVLKYRVRRRAGQP